MTFLAMGKEIVALSSWFDLQDMETGVGALLYAVFTGGVILDSIRFLTKCGDGGGHWDGIHHHPICC